MAYRFPGLLLMIFCTPDTGIGEKGSPLLLCILQNANLIKAIILFDLHFIQNGNKVLKQLYTKYRLLFISILGTTNT